MSKAKKFLSALGALALPLLSIAILLIFNLILDRTMNRNPSFFDIYVAKSGVLAGNLISIIDSASELAIIAMGMTLVTASCGGQDISVGAVAAISGAVFVKTLLQWFGFINGWTLAAAVILCCVTAILFKLFNGTLVAVFRIQPMIATLILYSCGRSIAYWINGDATPQLSSPIISAIGTTIPGIPIPTPVFIVILMGVIMFLIFKFTNLRLYTQSVGINEGAARLNGINPLVIKLLCFAVLGVCVAVAGVIGISRMGNLAHQTLLVDIEMDAILAVAIGGNSLGGGKFRMGGTILGAYTIQTLNTTLNAMIKDSPESIRAIKAAVIILIVVAGSPVVRRLLLTFRNWIVRQCKAVFGKKEVA